MASGTPVTSIADAEVCLLDDGITVEDEAGDEVVAVVVDVAVDVAVLAAAAVVRDASFTFSAAYFFPAI